MYSFHNKIMNIGTVEPVMPDDAFGRVCYKEGHSDARRAAAEIANEADGVIYELLEALRPFAAFACSPAGECGCHNCRARDVIAKAKGEL